jgi:DnaJ-class molecular chaperone
MKKLSPYEILEVSRDSSDDDIKKAYRRMSLKYHPDKNKEDGAVKKFQEISEAYDILSNPEKKQLFNMGGYDALNQQSGGYQSEQMIKKAESITIERDITLKEIYEGKKLNLRYKKNCVCKICAGSGSSKSSEPNLCKTCKGNGQIVQVIQVAMFRQEQRMECRTCGGNGYAKIPQEDACGTCCGRRVVNEEVEDVIEIPAGIPTHQPIAIPDKGHEDRDSQNGDLIIKFNVKKQKHWSREDNNLIHTLHLSVIDILCKDNIVVEHISGKRLLLPLKKIKKGENKLLIRDFGFPDMRARGGCRNGMLVVQIQTIYPELNPGQLSGLQKLFTITSFDKSTTEAIPVEVLEKEESGRNTSGMPGNLPPGMSVQECPVQ